VGPLAAAERTARRNASDFDIPKRRAISSSARIVSTSKVYVDLIVSMAILLPFFETIQGEKSVFYLLAFRSTVKLKE
jgi:hypothetical protein